MQVVDIKRYNQIPEYVLKGDVLEIGARRGEAQLASKHRDQFLSLNKEGRYHGIDALPAPDSPLNIIQQDFFRMEVRETFDTILALEVIEHIGLRDWSRFFYRLKCMVKPGGYIFLTTPYNEPTEMIHTYLPSYEKEPFGGHVVYGITPRVIDAFIEGMEFKRCGHRAYWREEGESLLKAVLRTINRIIRRHPWAWGWTGLKYSSLIMLWQKEEEE